MKTEDDQKGALTPKMKAALAQLRGLPGESQRRVIAQLRQLHGRPSTPAPTDTPSRAVGE